jgi:hypothetical protein
MAGILDYISSREAVPLPIGIAPPDVPPTTPRVN